MSEKFAVGRLPTAGDALAAPVHAPTLRGPASPAHATHPPTRTGEETARPRSASPLRDRTLPDAARRRLRVRSRCRRGPDRGVPASRFGNVDPTTFRGERRDRRGDRAFHGELSLPLGSTNPCPIDGHMEPYSTSVFKDLV